MFIVTKFFIKYFIIIEMTSCDLINNKMMLIINVNKNQ